MDTLVVLNVCSRTFIFSVAIIERFNTLITVESQTMMSKIAPKRILNIYDSSLIFRTKLPDTHLLLFASVLSTLKYCRFKV